MITFLSRHGKGTAALLLSVFFSQFCCSAYGTQCRFGYAYPSYSYCNLNPDMYGISPAALPHRTIMPDPAAPSAPVLRRLKENFVSIQNRAEQRTFSGPGPGQPEMQSFQSINNNNLVDLFSGDFFYSIPLLDVAAAGLFRRFHLLPRKHLPLVLLFADH